MQFDPREMSLMAKGWGVFLFFKNLLNSSSKFFENLVCIYKDIKKKMGKPHLASRNMRMLGQSIPG